MAAQCRLAGIARSTVYADKAEVDDVELMLLRLLDEEYTRHPFYGSRKMTVWLCARSRREPKACAAPDADIGPDCDGPRPEHQQKTS